MVPIVVRAIAITLLAGTSVLPASRAAAAAPYDFRGLALGAPVAELRRYRFAEAPNARILCSHDREATEMRPDPEFTVTTSEGMAGVVVCAPFNFGKILGPSSTTLPAEWIPARIKVGATEVTPTFWFVPAQGQSIEASGRLYRMALRTNTAFWDGLRTAMIARYGKPTDVESGHIPGVGRAIIESETLVWRNDESSIRLIKRSQRPNRLLVLFEHSTLTPLSLRDGRG